MKLKDYVGYRTPMPKIRSAKHALELATAHWKQNIDLTVTQILLLDFCNCRVIHGTFCALCKWHENDCTTCILAKNGQTCERFSDDSLYAICSDAYFELKSCQTTKHFRAWRKAARNMYKFLLSLEQKGKKK